VNAPANPLKEIPVTDQPTNLDLDDIEARANAATKAPWFATKDDTGTPVVFVNRRSPKDVTYSSVLWNADWATEADAEFTAHAREDVPALLSEVRRLRAELADARVQALRDAAEICDEAGSVYGSRGANGAAGAAFALMERFQRKANEAEYAATPCDPINPCEDGGEPCHVHERLMAHADGEHELCGPNCPAP
jgi:hypothetical protein